MPDVASQVIPPVLVFSWGNPSRGDDAIAHRIKETLAGHHLAGVELLTDFQLQIEHAVDLEQRAYVIFIDASVSATPPFEFARIESAPDNSYTTHALSPQALMAVYLRINSAPPPPCYLLSVRGYDFDLGRPLSATARRNADAALEFLLGFIVGRRGESVEN